MGLQQELRRDLLQLLLLQQQPLLAADLEWLPEGPLGPHPHHGLAGGAERPCCVLGQGLQGNHRVLERDRQTDTPLRASAITKQARSRKTRRPCAAKRGQKRIHRELLVTWVEAKPPWAFCCRVSQATMAAAVAMSPACTRGLER